MTAPALPRPTGAEPCRTAPDDWFTPATPKQARELCKGCPLTTACADYAMAYAVSGVWGATTESERDALRKRQGVTPIPIVNKLGPNSRMVDHGTEAGAQAHHRRYERPCEPCRKAELLIRQERREAAS